MNSEQAMQRRIELDAEAQQLEQEAQALAFHISKMELPASDGRQEEEKVRLSRLILHRLALASLLRAQLAFPFHAEADDLQRELQMLSAAFPDCLTQWASDRGTGSRLFVDSGAYGLGQSVAGAVRNPVRR